MSQAESLDPPELLAAEVAAYLRRHPSFFGEHREVLADLLVPHAMGRATSLVERQVAVLRERNAALERQLEELLEIARENDRLSHAVHHLGLALMRARSLEELLGELGLALRNEFGVDQPVLRIATATPPSGSAAELWVDPADPALELFEDFLASGRPRCGRMQAAQMQYLFGTSAAAIGSAALIPLSGPGWRGLLAIGGHDPERFHPGLGLLFVTRIGEFASAALTRYLSAGCG